MKKILTTCAFIASALVLSSCQSSNPPINGINHVNPVLNSTIYSVGNSELQVGEMSLRPVQGGVHVYGQISGLNPGSTVAVHIHEKGSCADMGKAAGGHYNPYDKPHGNPESTESHAGDLPNITADANGIATMDFVKNNISVAMSGTNSVYRRAIIVHGGVDDYQSQPAGDSGERIACGIIENI